MQRLTAACCRCLNALPPETLQVFADLDAQLIATVEQGDIRLISVEWLLASTHAILPRRQELEQLELAGDETPFYLRRKLLAMLPLQL